MKNAKKIAGVLLALVMVFSMAIPAFAVNSADTTGSITIENPAENQTYKIYKMFDLESYTADGQYAYKITNDWQDFVTTGYGKDYFQINDGNYVTVKDGVSIANDSDTAAAIAKEALAYAKDKGIAAVATLPDGTNYTANLDLGYYLVESSLGALCGLTTAKPDQKIKEKNAAPSVTKEVKEDSGDFGASNTADIGQTVEFKTTITVQSGAKNYVLHDIMDSTLALDEASMSVKLADGTAVPTDKYTIKTASTNPAVADGHTFDIEFNDDYVASLAAGTQIVVTYNAVLTANAVIAGDGNVNETYLKYGDNSETTHVKTTTYTYSFDVVKTDKDKVVLNGAEFELYTVAEGGTKIDLVKESEGVYRVATPAEKGAEGFTSAVIEAGKATVKGLDKDTYYLEETKQPDGYNKLTARQEFTINDANLDATVTAGAEGAADTYVSGGVQVINLTGSELPSTGGIGTTIFYIAGAVLLIGAGIFLVVRRRMRPETSAE